MVPIRGYFKCCGRRTQHISRVTRWSRLGDISNVMALGHNELWRPLEKSNELWQPSAAKVIFRIKNLDDLVSLFISVLIKHSYNESLANKNTISKPTRLLGLLNRKGCVVVFSAEWASCSSILLAKIPSTSSRVRVRLPKR